MIKKFFKEDFGRFLSWFAASITISICIGIVVYFLIKGISVLSLEFIFSKPNPTRIAENSGGISIPIIGTCVLTFISMALAFPLSLATAIYLAEYSKGNKIAGVFRLGIDVFSGIPSIVIAIFALAVFTNPQFSFLSEYIHGADKAFGRSFLVGGIAMALLVLPFMIKTCEEAIKSVPQSYREASLALGASKWQTTMLVVIPAATNGIITAITLGIGKVIGDTVIVLLTMGATLNFAADKWWKPSNYFDVLRGTGSTLTSYIFYTSPAGEGNLVSKSFGAALVLIILIIILNLFTDFISNHKKITSNND